MFRSIADWRYFAILSLSEVEGSSADARWIARRLGIKPTMAREILGRLEELGFITVEHGRFYQRVKAITTTRDVKDQAIRKFHRAVLSKAARALTHVPTDQRYLSAVVMAVDPDNLEKAKDRITKFRRQLCAELESGRKRRVYALSIQLCPVDEGAVDRRKRRRTQGSRR